MLIVLLLTNNIIMGKDKTGKFHPAKGKPAGGHKEEGLGLRKSLDPEQFEQDEIITERYTLGPDQLNGDVQVRHPNRNTHKGGDLSREEGRGDKNQKIAYADDRTPTEVEEIPGLLTREMFSELAGYNNGCCVSFYMQTSHSGVEVNEQKDLIKFKNFLQELKKTLSQKGIDEPGIQKMLEPGYDLLRNEHFWSKPGQGLAIFMSHGFFKYIKLPLEVDEELLIDKTFYITPLVPIVTRRDYFYLLVISKKQAKLFRADEFKMEFVNIPEIPFGVDDVVRIEDKNEEQTFRMGSRPGNGGGSFHGHGTGAADEKTQIAVYLEEVDDTIWKNVLKDENVPLLLAGVEYLIPIYKKVTDYNHIWEDALTGSHEHTDTQKLYELAKEKMQPFFRQRVEKAIESYGNQSATQLTSAIAEEVIPATYYGRVAHLFVAKGAHIWGTFNEMENQISMELDQGESDECLIDNAVEKTIMHGGEVYVLEREQMPAKSVIAAIMRY